MEKFFEPGLIDFPKFEDPRGNLTFIQQGKHLPFMPQRVYWTYDVRSGSSRQGRALRTCAEIIFATSGQCSVTLTGVDGRSRTFTLNRSNQGLYIPPMTWRTIDDFVTGSTCLIVASKLFDEADYIRDYQQFLSAAQDELF